MDRARKLYRAFGVLGGAVQHRPKLYKMFYPRYRAYNDYYLDLKNNRIAQVFEFTAIDGWVKEFAFLRRKAEVEGADVSRVPFIKPGGIIADVLPDVPVIPDIPVIPTPEDISKEMSGVVLLGVGALVLGGLVLFFVTRK
jgi:hypothetical protein